MPFGARSHDIRHQQHYHIALPPAAQTRIRLNLSDWSRTISASKSRCRGPHGRQSGRGGESVPTLRQCYHPEPSLSVGGVRSALRHRPADLALTQFPRTMRMVYSYLTTLKAVPYYHTSLGRAVAEQMLVSEGQCQLFCSIRSAPSSKHTVVWVCRALPTVRPLRRNRLTRGLFRGRSVRIVAV